MTEVMLDAKNTLAPKLAKASATVGGKLKADKRNKEQGYDYISADKILAEAGQALADQGVSIVPQITSHEITWLDRGNGKGRYDAHLKMLMLVTDGESQFLIPWDGWGSDYSVPDKAAYKALTSGDKYFRMKLLSIGEGNEDGEHENESEQKQRDKSEQRKPAQPEQKAPAAPTNGNAVKPPELTLTEAMAVTNSEGKAYGDLTTEQLSGMLIGIEKGLKKSGLTIEQRETYLTKKAAAELIIATRQQATA